MHIFFIAFLGVCNFSSFSKLYFFICPNECHDFVKKMKVNQTAKCKIIVPRFDSACKNPFTEFETHLTHQQWDNFLFHFLHLNICKNIAKTAPMNLALTKSYSQRTEISSSLFLRFIDFPKSKVFLTVLRNIT